MDPNKLNYIQEKIKEISKQSYPNTREGMKKALAEAQKINMNKFLESMDDTSK